MGPAPDTRAPPGPARSPLSGLRSIAAPLLVALAVRLCCLPLAAHLPEEGDGKAYAFLAREYREAQRWAWLKEGVRPPLHRVVVAPGLDVSTDPYDTYPGVFVIQIAADVLALALLLSVTGQRFGPRAARAAGWIYAFFPPAVLYASTVVMTESLAALATATVLWALHQVDRHFDHGVWVRVVTLGAALGLAILTKETMILTTVAVATTLALRARGSPTRRLGAAGLVVGLALLVTSPWAEHNRKVHGIPIMSGTYGEYSVVIDNPPPHQNGLLLWKGESDDISPKVAMARELFFRSLFEYPALTAERALARLRILLGPEIMMPTWLALPFDDAPAPPTRDNLSLFRHQWKLESGTVGRVAQILCGVGAVILLALGAAGVAALPRDTLARAALLMAVGLVVSAALTVAAARYRLGLVPFLLPFAGLSLDVLTQREPVIGRAVRRGLCVGLVVAAVLTTTIFLMPAP